MTLRNYLAGIAASCLIIVIERMVTYHVEGGLWIDAVTHYAVLLAVASVLGIGAYVATSEVESQQV